MTKPIPSEHAINETPSSTSAARDARPRIMPSSTPKTALDLRKRSLT
jgi:hypothetical protein